MDVREIGPLQPVASALERINRLFWWDHNRHFDRWILRRVPQHSEPMTTLDVGCGLGDLVDRLRERGFRVIGIDPDPEMAEVAAARFAGDPTVKIERAAFEQFRQPVDVITMVASLHHQSLADALCHARDLLKPSGRLLIVGLARSHSLADLGYDVTSSVLNVVVGLTRRLLGKRERPPEIPMLDPSDTFDDIAEVARRELPGVRIRRRLFFRYTLEWHRDPEDG